MLKTCRFLITSIPYQRHHTCVLTILIPHFGNFEKKCIIYFISCVNLSGHYLYMESSVPNRPGHKSRLLSPVYPWYKSRRCFQLWYHMLGPDETGCKISIYSFTLFAHLFEASVINIPNIQRDLC